MYLQPIACLCRLEIIMKNEGNQKHLSFEQRVYIEKGLTENKSFAEIGRIIGEDFSTVSKEVCLHTRIKERPDSGYTNPPCIHRKNVKCPVFVMINAEPCVKSAKSLRNHHMYCNGCGKKTHCIMPRMFYSSRYAHDEYRSVLVDSRVGINQTPESIQAMNDLLVPLIKDKRQSIEHIYATHTEELGCSKRTLYSYINDCVFDVHNGDLRYKVILKYVQ